MLLMKPDPFSQYSPQSFRIPDGSLAGRVIGSPSMTMVPVGNPFHGGSSSCGLMSRVEEGYECSNNLSSCNLLGSSSSSSDHHHHHHHHQHDHQHNLVIANNNYPTILMAEEESSRTLSSLNEAAASSSRDVQEEKQHDEGWLQLTIGGGHLSKAGNNNGKSTKKFEVDQEKSQRGAGLVELDLLPPGPGDQARPIAPPVSPILTSVQQNVMMNVSNYTSPYSFFQLNPAGMGISSGSISFPHHQEVQWASFRPNVYPPSVLAGSSTSLSSPSSSPSNAALMPIGSYFGRPVQVQMAGMDVGGSSSDIRIVNVPRRSHSSIWFMLQASQNQAREPILPQIPKSFLRIKDGRMTVRLLMKYLVNKLRLDNESEIEIRCRGQQLLPYLTLQHVRDNIWSPRDAFVPSSLLPSTDSSTSTTSTSTIDHLMVLHYGRSAS